MKLIVAKTTRQKKPVIVSILLLIFMLGWGFRYITLNLQWPDLATVTVSRGDKYSLNGIALQVTDSKMGQDIEVAQYFNPTVCLDDLEKTPNMKAEGWTQIMLGVRIEATNTTEKTIVFDVAMLSLEYHEWYTNADVFAAPFYNHNGSSSSIQIAPNETVSYVVPFNLYKEQFSKAYWSALEELPFYIPLIVYPQKIAIMI